MLLPAPSKLVDMTHSSARSAHAPQRRRVGRVVAGIGLTAALLGGGGVAFAAPASAQDDPPARERPSVEERQVRHDERIDQLLADGRITDAQAQRMRDRAAAHAERNAARTTAREALATTLGLSVDEMHTALRSGSSLAELGEAAGVDRQDLVDQLVTGAIARLDAAVAANKLTPAQADEKRDAIAEHAQAKIDGERPERADDDRGRRGNGPRRGHGQKGPRGSR